MDDRSDIVLSRHVALAIACLDSREYAVGIGSQKEKKKKKRKKEKKIECFELLYASGWLCVHSWPRRMRERKREKERESEGRKGIETGFGFRVVKPDQPRPKPSLLLPANAQCRTCPLCLALSPPFSYPVVAAPLPRFPSSPFRSLDCFRIKQPWESLETTRKEGFRRFSYRSIQPEGKLIITRCCVFAFPSTYRAHSPGNLFR